MDNNLRASHYDTLFQSCLFSALFIKHLFKNSTVKTPISNLLQSAMGAVIYIIIIIPQSQFSCVLQCNTHIFPALQNAYRNLLATIFNFYSLP